MTSLPPWLLARLENQGLIDGATRLTKKAKPRRCPDCGLFTLAGLEDCLGGAPVFADFLPTTSAGELFALLTDRGTYGIQGDGLYRRYDLQIQGKPADQNRVHVDHVCNGPPLPVNPRFAPQAETPRPTDPPF